MYLNNWAHCSSFGSVETANQIYYFQKMSTNLSDNSDLMVPSLSLQFLDTIILTCQWKNGFLKKDIMHVPFCLLLQPWYVIVASFKFATIFCLQTWRWFQLRTMECDVCLLVFWLTKMHQLFGEVLWFVFPCASVNFSVFLLDIFPVNWFHFVLHP